MTTLSLLLCLCLQSAVDTTAIEVMTFNVRYDNPNDGEHAWEHRKEMVDDIMSTAQIIGVQEALYHQVEYLAEKMPKYRWFGVGRDDGIEAGEYSPVFYQHELFEVIEWGTFWLSEEPNVPGSVGWDAAITRIATWGNLRHLDSGKDFWVFNTHFDHRGVEARPNSARLLMSKVNEMVPEVASVIVMGDFNSTEDTEAYQVMVSGRLSDAIDLSTDNYIPEDEMGTFSGFKKDSDRVEVRIDHIFVDSSMLVDWYSIIDLTVDGRYASDHRPVVAHVHLK